MQRSKIVAIVFTALFALFIPGYLNDLYRLGLGVGSIVLGAQLLVVVLAIAFGFKKKYYGTVTATAIAGILASLYSASMLKGMWLPGLIIFEVPSLFVLLVSIANLVGGTKLPPTKWHTRKRLVEAMAKAYGGQRNQQEKETKHPWTYAPTPDPVANAMFYGATMFSDEEQQ